MSLESTIMSPQEFAAWEARADVLYHFYAYHYFDQEPRHSLSIDLINLDDADVQFYNRTSDQTHRFSAHHKLANYLLNPPAFNIPLTNQDEFGVVFPKTIRDEMNFTAEKKIVKELTLRERFIQHVRMYNLTQEPRRRFFLVGLSSGDMEFINSLISKNFNNTNGTKGENEGAGILRSGLGEKGVAFATDGCLTFAPTASQDVKDHVALEARKFLLESNQSLSATAESGTNGSALVNLTSTMKGLMIAKDEPGVQNQVASDSTDSTSSISEDRSSFDAELQVSLERFASDKNRKIG